MKEALQKAIEGGWKPNSNVVLVRQDGEVVKTSATPSVGDCFLDPLFWQALGKAMWWNTTEELSAERKAMLIDQRLDPHAYQQDWQYYWHLFIQHLAEGKDAESFFNELLK